MNLIGCRSVNGLNFTRGPANYGLLEFGEFSQTKMQPPLTLRGKTAATGNFLRLLLAVPEHADLRSDSAAIALCALEFKLDPLVFRRDGVLVDQQRPAFIGHDHIEHAAIPQIREGHGAAVVGISHAHGLRDVDELSAAVVQPDVFGLIAAQAAAFHGRPVFGVVDDSAVSAGNFGKVIPITLVAIQRNVTVGQIQIQRAIVIQIAELRAKTPTADFHAKIARQIFVLKLVSAGAFFGHPQIISLNEHAFLGNIGNVNGVAALIENIAKAGVHSAFGSETDAGLFAGFMEALAVVDIKFGDAVIVGDEQVRVPSAAQVGRNGCQRPATTVDANFFANLFKFPVAQIVKKIFAAPIFRVLKTVRHHLGGREMPKIDVFRVVAADKQIQQTVAVV